MSHVTADSSADSVEAPIATEDTAALTGAPVFDPHAPKVAGVIETMKVRNFRIFIIGAFLSNLGTWTQSAALSWLLLELTDSAFLVSMVPAAQFGPLLLFGIPGGVIVDRFDRKRVLLLAQIIMAVTAAALAAITYAGWVSAAVAIPLVALGGSAMALHAPAFHALMSDMLPRTHVPAAISINSAQFSMARVIGPAVGGYIVHLSGAGIAFALNAVSFLFVIGALLAIHVPGHEKSSPISRSSFTTAFKVIGASRRLETMLVLAIFLSLAGAPVVALLPVMARDVLGRGADFYGHLFASFGLGTAIGGLASHQVLHRIGFGRLVIVGGVAQGVLLAGFSASRTVWLSFTLILVYGLLHGATFAANMSSVQMLVPNESRGRVISLFMVAFAGLFPVGSLVGGAVADAVGAPATLAATGAATVLLSLVAIRFRERLAQIKIH